MDYFIAFLALISLNFAMPRLLPGNPLTAIYADEILRSMSPEMKAELIAGLGLDKPIHVQYLLYLKSLIRFDLGTSYYYNDSVIRVILDFLPWTLLLVSSALILSTFFGFLLGIESACSHGKNVDRSTMIVVMFINGFPQFLIGILLLLVFSLGLEIFPVYGAYTPNANLTGWAWIMDILWHMILPLTSIVAFEVSSVYLLSRNTAVTLINRPFLQVGRAKGLKKYLLKYRYIGRNTLPSVLMQTGVSLGRMFTGALIVEVVFSYPGLGRLIYDSISCRDYPVVQGAFFLIALMVFGINLISEILLQRWVKRV